jgi:hypothetical protein
VLVGDIADSLAHGVQHLIQLVKAREAGGHEVTGTWGTSMCWGEQVAQQQ